MPQFHGRMTNKAGLPRLHRTGPASTRPHRAQHLQPHRQALRDAQARRAGADKRRLAFAKSTPTRCGRPTPCSAPMCKHRRRPGQSKLIAFIDDASRVVRPRPVLLRREHRQPHRAPCARASTSAASPRRSTWITARSTPPRRSSRSAPASACSCATRRCATERPRARSNGSSAPCATSSSARKLDLSSLEALNRQFTALGRGAVQRPRALHAGMKPVDRFGLDRRASASCRPTRSTRSCSSSRRTACVKDNTFSFKSVRYEAPRDLPSRKSRCASTAPARPQRGRLLQGRTHGRGPPARLLPTTGQTANQANQQRRTHHDPFTLRTRTHPFDMHETRRCWPISRTIFDTLKVHCPAGRPVPDPGRARHRQERHQAGRSSTTIPSA